MPDEHHTDLSGTIVDFIHNAIITDADSPVTVGTDEFLATRGARLGLEPGEGPDHPSRNLGGKPIQVALRLALKEYFVHAVCAR